MNVERQLALETECSEIGFDRIAQRDAEQLAGGSIRYRSSTAALVNDVGAGLEAAIERRRQKGAPELLRALPASIWAALTLNLVLSSRDLAGGIKWTGLALAIVDRAVQEVDFRVWSNATDSNAAQARFAMQPARGKRYGRKVRELLADADTTRDLWGSTKHRLEAGAALLFDLVQQGGGWFESWDRWERGRQRRYLRLTTAGQEALVELVRDEAFARPARMPMLVQPAPYTEEEQS